MPIADSRAPTRTDGPQLLVADDDAATRQFLAGALGAQGYRVTLAVDGEDALRAAGAQRFDALLLDCRMPRGGAAEVLAALRGDPAAASRHAVALATSAEVPAALRSALLDAGFAGVVEKPCRVATLADALAATLGVDRDVRVLDDQAALTATGDADTMRALRQLLHAELVELHAALPALAGDPPALVEQLHRLRSACGFCGAARLAMQARALQVHAQEARVVASEAVERFRIEVDATLSALTTG